MVAGTVDMFSEVSVARNARSVEDVHQFANAAWFFGDEHVSPLDSRSLRFRRPSENSGEIDHKRTGARSHRFVQERVGVVRGTDDRGGSSFKSAANE